MSDRHDAGNAVATGRRTGSRRADGTGRQPPTAFCRPWAARRDGGATWTLGAESLSGCRGCCRRGSAWRPPVGASQPAPPGYQAPAACAGHNVEGARVPAPRGRADCPTSYRSSAGPQPPGRSARPSPACPETACSSAVPGLKQRPTEVGERPQRPVDCCLGVVDTGVAELGSLAPDPADDAIVSLDQGISDPRLPFHGSHRQDGQPSAVEHLAQAVRKMPLPLPSQAGNTVGR